MDVPTSAKGQLFTLSVNGEPAYSRCDAYVKDGLKKVVEIKNLEINNINLFFKRVKCVKDVCHLLIH